MGRSHGLRLQEDPLAPGVCLILVPRSLPPRSPHGKQACVMGRLPESCWSAPPPPRPGSRMLAWTGRGEVRSQHLPAWAPARQGCSPGLWKRVLRGSHSHRRSGDGHPVFCLFCSGWAPATRPRPALKGDPCTGSALSGLGHNQVGLLFPGPRARGLVTTHTLSFTGGPASLDPPWSLDRTEAG